ncbi:MAG: hypothetical protein IPK80_16440 [Nannocystis sp.]|nr:hypothetical protein [Nannocystis sp.]
MNKEIHTMLTASEGRYPTKAELALLLEWSDSLDGRLAAIEELRAKEEAIVRQALAEITRAFPDLEKRMRDARQKCSRDLTLVLRYCAGSLLRNDMKYFEDSFLTWFATILRGIGFAYDFVIETYQSLARQVAAELSPAAAELFRPYLELCITTFTRELEGQKGAAS